MKLLLVLLMICAALVALPLVTGAFGLLVGICGTLVGLVAGVLGVIAGAVSLLIGLAVLLAPIWIPVLLIVGIVSLCNRSSRST